MEYITGCRFEGKGDSCISLGRISRIRFHSSSWITDRILVNVALQTVK